MVTTGTRHRLCLDGWAEGGGQVLAATAGGLLARGVPPSGTRRQGVPKRVAADVAGFHCCFQPRCLPGRPSFRPPLWGQRAGCRPAHDTEDGAPHRLGAASSLLSGFVVFADPRM